MVSSGVVLSSEVVGSSVVVGVLVVGGSYFEMKYRYDQDCTAFGQWV